MPEQYFQVFLYKHARAWRCAHKCFYPIPCFSGRVSLYVPSLPKQKPMLLVFWYLHVNTLTPLSWAFEKVYLMQILLCCCPQLGTNAREILRVAQCFQALQSRCSWGRYIGPVFFRWGFESCASKPVKLMYIAKGNPNIGSKCFSLYISVLP